MSQPDCHEISLSDALIENRVCMSMFICFSIHVCLYVLVFLHVLVYVVKKKRTLTYPYTALVEKVV
jgi:hypothetical protein